MKQLFIIIFILIYCSSSFASSTDLQTIKNKGNYLYQKYIKIKPGEKKSVLEKRILSQEKTAQTGFTLLPYKPNYILPYYYTGSPLQKQNIPIGNSKVNHEEFKFQLSLLAPLIINLYNKKINILAAYTQLSFWQFYNKSQWFRETNYEPELMLTYNINLNILTSTGIIHQSNGRGGDFERSWNRLFGSIAYSRNDWLLALKFWFLIFKKQSSLLHNPKISKYLGHEELLYSHKFFNKLIASAMIRNIEQPKYSTFILNISYPISTQISVYVELFHGYGQSLIEYDNKTNSAGIGIALSNWI